MLLTIVGTAAERHFGRARWLLFYVAAGVAGQLAGLAWQPHGAGNSVAALGLAGALGACAWRSPDATGAWSVGYPCVVAVLLLGADVGGAAGTALSVTALVAPSVAIAVRRHRPDAHVTRVLAVALGVLAVALVIAQDIHGPATLTGAALAAMLP